LYARSECAETVTDLVASRALARKRLETAVYEHGPRRGQRLGVEANFRIPLPTQWRQAPDRSRRHQARPLMIAPMNFANTKILAQSLPDRYRGTDRPTKDDGTRFLLLNAKITGFNLLFRLVV
jgi:hypothetical protein